MTIDETRDQSGNTPEQIITDALYADEPEIHPQSGVQFMKASRRASVAATALRTAGLLVAGDTEHRALIEEAQIRLETGRPPGGRQLYIADDESLIRRLQEALQVDFSSPVGVQLQVEGAPTDEQVERAARAFYEDPAGLTSWLRMSEAEPEIAERYRVAIRRALAAAGVAPPAPSANRDLIAEARELASFGSGLNPAEADRLIGELCDALAAPSPVDEAKLAEVVDDAQRRWNGSGRREPIATAITREVLTLLRGEGR